MAISVMKFDVWQQWNVVSMLQFLWLSIEKKKKRKSLGLFHALKALCHFSCFLTLLLK